MVVTDHPCPACGTPNYTPNDAAIVTGDILMGATVRTLVAISRRLGHTTPGATTGYIQREPDDPVAAELREAVLRVARGDTNDQIEGASPTIIPTWDAILTYTPLPGA